MKSKSIKQIELLDLSNNPKMEIHSIPPSPDDNPKPQPGRKVLVQTERAKDLNFYIVLEVMSQQNGRLVGKVIGPEGYEGPRDKIFPGEYLKFEFDGLTIDDLVWFERKNVDLTF